MLKIKKSYDLSLIIPVIISLAFLVFMFIPSSFAASGTCGTADGKYYDTKPTAYRCSTGTFDSTRFEDASGNWAAQDWEDSVPAIDTPAPLGWPLAWRWKCIHTGSTGGDAFCRANFGTAKDTWGINTTNCNSSNPGCGDAFCGVGAGTSSYLRPDGTMSTGGSRCYTTNGGSFGIFRSDGYYNELIANYDNFWHWNCDGPTHSSPTGNHNIGCGSYKKLDAQCNEAVKYGCKVKPYPGQTITADDNTRILATTKTEDSYYWYWVCEGYPDVTLNDLYQSTFGKIISSNEATPGTDSATCKFPKSVNGACGAAARAYSLGESSYTQPLCSPGTASPVSPAFPGYGSSSTWTCTGLYGGSSSSVCTASMPQPTCSVKPTVGSSPLVAKIEYSGGGSVQSINMGDGTVYSGGSIKPSGFLYTYKNNNNYTITVTYPGTSCRANIKATSPKSSSGGEVAP